MIRNRPRSTTQKELTEELDGSGLREGYDFCYLPSDFESRL